MCGLRFKMTKNLNRHMQTHTGLKPYICPECGKSFANKRTMDVHILIHSGEKPHACSNCEYRTARKEDLNRNFFNSHWRMAPCMPTIPIKIYPERTS